MKDAGAGAGRGARVPDTIVEMLKVSEIFKCRDDQDLVYALLGMSEEAVEFRVDYKEKCRVHLPSTCPEGPLEK